MQKIDPCIVSKPD